MLVERINVAIVGACCASLCSAESPAYLFKQQASPGDRYGWCVASAGDTDGDGQPDILVGAPFDDMTLSPMLVHVTLSPKADPA